MNRRTLLLTFFLSVSTFLLGQTSPSGEQLQLFNLVNHERETHGLTKFQWDDHLAQSAAAHNRLVTERQELSHQFPGEPPLGERVGATGLRFNSVGENPAEANTHE